MASTVAREQPGMTIEQQQQQQQQHVSEIDSESSSGCEDRDARKRLREDADNNSTGSSPKKRRKQTTPVRFPATPMGPGGDPAESEDEADDNVFDDDAGEPEDAPALPLDEDSHPQLEGKPRTLSPQAFIRNILQTATTTTTKDENLNSEFRCQFCGHSFDARDALGRHLECEHGMTKNSFQQTSSGLATDGSPVPGQVRVKVELGQQTFEEPESPVNLTGLGIKSFAANWLNSQGQTQQNAQSSSQCQNPDDWSSANPATALSNHIQALSFPGALAQYLPLPGFSLNDAGQLPRPPVGPAPVRIFNPDAYCDLCNKEFCNKYFLKTHRANKHGIYVDGPTSNSGDNNSVGNFFTGAFNSGNVQMEQQSQRLEVPVPLISVPLNNAIPCDVCQKRFKNDDSLKKHKQKVHNDSIDNQESHSLPATGSSADEDASGNSPSAMEALFKQEFGVEQEDSKFMPAPRHLSPQSSQQARDSGFSADRLRRLGVLNPEAFCEICCKEYCNKYFLRTHKMKRHGICVQESDKSPGNPGTAATWHQIQTSPLNLIVAEGQPGSSSESGDRSADDFDCKPCGLRFQTPELRKAHRAKIHDDDDDKSNDYDPESTDQRTESISEDLQKLQTMILQLNGLNASRSSSCNVCGKDCDNIDDLRNHVTLEHGGSSEDAPSPGRPNDPSPVGTSTFCTVCEKDYQTPEALRRHINDDHRSYSNNTATSVPQVPTVTAVVPMQPPTPSVTAPVAVPTPSTASLPATPTTPAQPEKKTISMTPTSSYCEICNKELCNKYFMKTHMQRMHNIEIENGSQIGGVICNICNKELCSKYFLRVHKQNTHGIVDESSATAANKQDSYEAPVNDDTALKPDQLGDLSHRYFTHFTEVCPICSRRFRSIKWLKAHLLGEHGRPGIEKWRELENQYQNSTRGSVRSSGTSGRLGSQNQSLKIPNGLDVMQQMKGNDYAGLGNQVLSSLFGSAVDEQAKNYRCSYCNFTTTVLPFLFLHERSHASPQDNNPGVEGSLQCPICPQAFGQPELLHHHLLTHHQFSGLLSQFQTPVINHPRLDDGNFDRNNDNYEKNDFEVKDERRQGSPQASVNAESVKNPKSDDQVVRVTPQGAFKCAQCGFATANVNRIRKHVRKDHKTFGDATESVIDELSKTLRDVANKHKLPASYAMPQDMNSNPDATVMQPFLIEERDATVGETAAERRFAPALVYLPVRARVNSVLTASFTLSPA